MAILTTPITYGGSTPTQNPNGGLLTADLIFRPVLSLPSFSSLGYDIRDNIQSSADMYNIIPSDKVTRKKTTCGWNPYGNLGELTDSKITVVELAIEQEQCATDLDGKILQLLRKKGYDRYDLTDTQFEEILRELAAPVVSRDMNRIISLADSASASADYNQLDGKWKKIVTGVTGGTITKAYDLPDSGALAAGAARTALDAVHFGAPIELQTLPDDQKVKVVTRSVYNNYVQGFASNADLESSMVVLANGLRTVTHWGVPVVVEDLVDAYVAADAASIPNANPHRIYYTALNNITIGTDLESDFTFVDFWYEKKEQMNLMRVNYKLGVAFAWDKLFSVAY